MAEARHGAYPLHLAVVIGTRPEAIKLAPVILAAQARPQQFRISTVRTGQHRELVDEVMEEFGLRVDVDLKIMRAGQDLAHVMAESVRGLSDVFATHRPDWALVQGDTTTTLAGALAAFYNRIRIGHVEAGLRTGTRHSPFPEKTNRVLTTRLVNLHLAPTEGARRNLLGEGIEAKDVVVTGNTVVDALRHALGPRSPSRVDTPGERRYALVTVHRRENHGAALERICAAVLGLLDLQPDLDIWLPMHPNPAVRKALQQRLGGHPRVRLTDALGYRAFVAALDGCVMVLSDSGGIQEECAALGKPMLILREQTERPEAVTAGVAVVVGTETHGIVEAAYEVLTDRARRRSMSNPSKEFGSGDSATRILDALLSADSAARDRREIPPAIPD